MSNSKQVSSNPLTDAGISWVVIGGQSHPISLPRIGWVKEIVEACDENGIPVWLKNKLCDLLSGNSGLSYEGFWSGGTAKLRQELPGSYPQE